MLLNDIIYDIVKKKNKGIMTINFKLSIYCIKDNEHITIFKCIVKFDQIFLY